MRHPRGQVGVKKSQLLIFLKVHPEKVNLRREIISHEKFDTVPHLGQTTNFEPFQGNLGVKCGSKRSKTASLAEKIPEK